MEEGMGCNWRVKYQFGGVLVGLPLIVPGILGVDGDDTGITLGVVGGGTGGGEEIPHFLSCFSTPLVL